MDTKNHNPKTDWKDRSINGSNPDTFYKPQSKLEKWLVAIACATFFPLVYLIGRAVIYLFG